MLLTSRLVHLIRGNARRRLEAAHLVDADALVADAGGDALQDVAGEVFSRRVQLDIKRREFVDVAVVKILYDLIRCRLKLHEVNEQTDVIQLAPARVDFNLLVMAVQVLALPLVAAQLMRA